MHYTPAQLAWLAQHNVTLSLVDGRQVFACGRYEAHETEAGWAIWDARVAMDPAWDLPTDGARFARERVGTEPTRGQALRRITEGK